MIVVKSVDDVCTIDIDNRCITIKNLRNVDSIIRNTCKTETIQIEKLDNFE